MDIGVEMVVWHVKRKGDRERREQVVMMGRPGGGGRETLTTKRRVDGGGTRDRQTSRLEGRTYDDGKDKRTKKGLQDRERADKLDRDRRRGKVVEELLLRLMLLL